MWASISETFWQQNQRSHFQRDPWHMFSSFFQYLLLAPSFTNVLNVYAFCNLHDVCSHYTLPVTAWTERSQVSWGTKGSDKAEALPSVSSSKTKDADSPVVVDTAKVQEDVDAAFKETVTRAITKIDVKETVEKPTMDDQNKTFRTRLVASWMITNAGLAIAIENLNGLATDSVTTNQAELAQKQNIYFAVILYSTFGLAAVRFTGVSA
jgi:chitin synthase